MKRFCWYDSLWGILRPLAIALCVAIAVAGIAVSAWNALYGAYLSPMDEEAASTVTFTVASGSSLSKVARQLEEAGLIHNHTVFRYYADFLGYAQKIKAGDYRLSAAMSMQEILKKLTTGTGGNTMDITIIPGWNIETIAVSLVEQGALDSVDSFLNLCRTGKEFAAYYYVTDVLSSPNASLRLFLLEGYLAPDTYEIYRNASAEDIIRKLLSQTEAVYPPSYHERAAALNMTMDEVLTLASIIEKEAQKADFARVSAVFHLRLKQGMSLESDATIRYINGIQRMTLTDEDLAVVSPYNTYQVQGLPPGPICSPSAAAIRAALYPDESFMEQGYLYFCPRDPKSGDLYFSRTYEEYQWAVSVYAPLWQAYDREQAMK